MEKLLFIFIFGIVFFAGCDNVTQTESDIRKYEEMTPFFDSECIFVSGKLDIDVSILTCTFKMIKSGEFLLDELKRNGWEIVLHEGDNIRLERNSNRYLDASRSRNLKSVLTITFKADNVCYIKWFSESR